MPMTKRRTRFPSVESELEAIEAKAAVWIIKSKQSKDRMRLITLAHQAIKFSTETRATILANSLHP